MIEDSKILSQSRLESIHNKLGYIDPVCLLLGIINTSNSASSFIDKFNREKILRLSNENVASCFGDSNLSEQDNIYLTQKAESILKISGRYQQKDNSADLNGIYLLLGLTTFTNDASNILLTEGILFEGGL